MAAVSLDTGLRAIRMALLAFCSAFCCSQQAASEPTGDLNAAVASAADVVDAGQGSFSEPRPRARTGTSGNLTGLQRMPTALSHRGEVLTMGLGFDYFTQNGILVAREGGDEDRNVRLRGGFQVVYSPTSWLELGGSVRGVVNQNLRVCSPGGACVDETDRTDPEVIKDFGELGLAAKLRLLEFGDFSFGTSLDFRLPNPSDSFEPEFNAFALGGRVLTSYAPAKRPAFPSAHLNLGFVRDDSFEVRDFDQLSPSSQVVFAFAEEAHKDRLTVDAGLEWSLDRIWGAWGLYPTLEYHLAYVTEDPQPGLEELTDCDGDSQCLDSRLQQGLTLAVRASAPQALTVTLGAEIGLDSVGLPFGSPLPNVAVLFGISRAFDLGAPEVITRTKTVTVVERQVVEQMPKVGTVTGRVLQANRGGRALPSAVIQVVGGQAGTVSDSNGLFTLTGLAPGPIQLVAKAPGFDSANADVLVVADQQATVDFSLVEPPITGAVLVSLTDPPTATDQRPPAVLWVGDKTFSLSAGAPVALELAPGTHRLVLGAPSSLSQSAVVEVIAGERHKLLFQRIPRAKRERWSAAKGRWVLAQRLELELGAEQSAAGAQRELVLSSSSRAALLELADKLLQRRAAVALQLELPGTSSIAMRSKVQDFFRKRGIPARVSIGPSEISRAVASLLSQSVAERVPPGDPGLHSSL